MADLNKKLIRNQSGQLQQVTDQTTNQLAAGKGLLKPINPLQATLAGANKDQAKMAGTPNQILGLAQQDPNKLQKTLPQVEQQSSELGSKLSQQQQQAKEKSQNLQSLTTLGDRISGYITSATQTAVGGNQDLSKVTVAQNVQDPAVQEALQALLAGDTSKLNIVAAAKGKRADQLSFDDFKDLYNDPTGQMAQKIATLLPDQIKFSDSIATDLGFTSQELSEILGVPDIKQYSLSQIDELVRDQSAQANNQVLALQAKLQDPNLSPEERDALQSQLLETGYVGANVTVEDFNKLADTLDSQQEIKIGDETLNLDELLADPAITSFIQEYIQNPESQIAKDLKERIPGLTDFVDQNRDAVAAMFQQMDTGTKTAIDNYKYNLNLKNTESGALPDELMDAIMPGWDEWSNQRKQDVPPVLKYFNDTQIPSDNRTTYYQRVTKASADGDQAILKTLSQFAPEQIQAYGLDDPNNRQGFNTWVQSTRRAAALEPLTRDIGMLYNRTHPNPKQAVDKVLTGYFGRAVDSGAMLKQINDAKYLANILGQNVTLPQGVDPAFLNLSQDPQGLAITLQANLRQYLDPSRVKENLFVNLDPNAITDSINAQVPRLKALAPAKIDQIRKVEAPKYAEHIAAQSNKISALVDRFKNGWKGPYGQRFNYKPGSKDYLAAEKEIADANRYLKQLQDDRQGMLMQALTLESLIQ